MVHFGRLFLLLPVLVLVLTACGGGGGGGGGVGAGGTPIPEINVADGAVSIASGGTDSLGNVAVGTPQTLTFTISNLGGAVLNLTGAPAVAVSGQSNCTATVTSQPAASIAASGASNAVVSLTVSGSGAFGFTVSIANDDANENPYVFTVQGTGFTGAPDIDAFIGPCLLTNGGTFSVARMAMESDVAVPLVIRNAGNVALNLTGSPSRVAISGVSNGSVSVRNQPAASVAAGDATVCMLLVTAGTTGTLSASFSIANNVTGKNPFTFTLQWPINANQSALYARDVTGSDELWSTTVPGGTTAQLSPPQTGSGTGLGSLFHLGDRAMFFCDPGSVGVEDGFLRGIAPALPSTTQNLCTPLIAASPSYNNNYVFNGSDNWIVQIASGATLRELGAITVNGASATSLTTISGTVPGGATSGVINFSMSPLGNRCAFIGEMQTAGTFEVFVVPISGGTRQRVSGPAGGKVMVSGSTGTAPPIWSPDGRGLLHFLFNPANFQESDLYYVDLTQTTPAGVRINGVVPASHQGVASAAYCTTGRRIFYLSDEGGATGVRSLYQVSLIGGTPSAPLNLRGGAVPIGIDIAEFSVNSDGTRALFSAGTGPGGISEIYLATINGTGVTTVKVVSASLATSYGAYLQHPTWGILGGFQSDQQAVYFLDDVVAGRIELHYLDLSGTPASTRISSGPAFPSGSSGVTTFWVFPDLSRIVFLSDQGGTAAGVGGMQLASFSATPGTQRLNSATTVVDLTGGFQVRAGRLLYNHSVAGGAIHLFMNNASSPGEAQLSGAEVGTGSVGTACFFGLGRVIYTVANGASQLWTATTTTPVQTRISVVGHQVDYFDAGQWR